MKKVFSLFLSLVMAATACFGGIGAVYADSETEVDFGNQIKGVYDSETATLTISCDTEEANMLDWDINKTYENIDNIKTVKVEKNIVRIGRFALYNCTNLEKVLVYNPSCAIVDTALPDNKSIEIYSLEKSEPYKYALEKGYGVKNLYSVTFISFDGKVMSLELYPEGMLKDDIPFPEHSDYAVYYKDNKHKVGAFWNQSDYNDTLIKQLTYTEISKTEGCSFSETVTPPTCTEKGYTIHTCVCGNSYVDSYTDPTGHVFDGGKNCIICGADNPDYVDPTEPEDTTTTTKPVITQPVPQPIPDTSITSNIHTPTVSPADQTQKPSETSSTTTKTASAVKKPGKTSISKLTKGKKYFKVTWKKVSAVSGYQIQYSTSKKFTKKTTKAVTVKGNKAKKPSKTIKKLKSKKTYYVRVRTYKTVKVNGKAKKVYSSWSKVKSVKIK